MTTNSIFWRILISFGLVVTLLIGGVASFFLVTMHGQHQQMAHEQLLVQARVISAQVEPLLLDGKRQEIDQVCRALSDMGVARATVILPDGRVIGDSAEDYRHMHNHRERPEIREALEQARSSVSTRHSPTLGKEMIYMALPVIVNQKPLAVVRTAMPLTAWREAHRAVRNRIIGAVIVTFGLAVLLTFLLSRAVWAPLQIMKETAQHFARGDFGWRVPLDSPEEISSLADAMNLMAVQLENKIEMIARQQHEQRAIFASMHEGIIALDSHNHILSLNDAAARMLEIDVKTAPGRALEDITRQQALFDVMARLRADEPLAECDIVLQAGDLTRYLQIRATRLHYAGERTIGILLVLNDVSRLQRLENMRRDFVANVSHELKTPITTIKGFVETLQDNHCDPRTTARYLQIVASQTDRLVSIINDLLSLSRAEVELETEGIAREETDLAGIVGSALEICRLEAENKHITLDVHCPPEIKLALNSALMEQALLNLVGNAVKYSEPDTQVSITTSQTADEVTIEVADQGMGIEPEHLPRIFERFYRVDKNRSRKQGGTGLGLAIVKHIARVHKGRVEVESTPGKGSVFRLILPRMP